MLAACVSVNVPPIAILSQLVALNMNSGRSIVTLTRRSCSGMPSSTVGSGSEVIVNEDVSGFTLIAERFTTVPFPVVPASVYGPAFAGTTIESPYGAPLYGPVMYTFPPLTRNGSAPGPVSTVVSPIWLAGPHVPASPAVHRTS